MARYEAKLDIGGEFEASFSLPLFTGDSGNSVALEFYNRGKAYDMSGAMIYARRGDGTVLATSGVTEGNKAEFTLYNNMYAYPGELQVQVSVVDVYGNFLTSGVLYFTVQEGFSQQSEGEGSNDFCELTSLIRQVGEGLVHIERAESVANEIESFLQLNQKPITYKGSKLYYSQLPTTGNSVGDVWNVAYPSEISIKAMPITITDTNDMVEDVGFATAHVTESFSEDTWLHSGFIYNSNGEKVTDAYPSSNNILEMPIFIEIGNYYFYFIEESLQKYHTDSLKLSYETDENCKFIWNGYEWQTFTGNMSKYVTKEELGNMEEALDAIIAIQDSLIQEGA